MQKTAFCLLGSNFSETFEESLSFSKFCQRLFFLSLDVEKTMGYCNNSVPDSTSN